MACYRSVTHLATGGAYDSHHRTAGIAGCTRRRCRLAARGESAAADAGGRISQQRDARSVAWGCHCRAIGAHRWTRTSRPRRRSASTCRRTLLACAVEVIEQRCELQNRSRRSRAPTPNWRLSERCSLLSEPNPVLSAICASFSGVVCSRDRASSHRSFWTASAGVTPVAATNLR